MAYRLRDKNGECFSGNYNTKEEAEKMADIFNCMFNAGFTVEKIKEN